MSRYIDADKITYSWQIDLDGQEHDGVTLQSIINKMPTIDAIPQWIPCSERLPEPKDGVLIYTSYDFIDIGWFREDGDWDSELGCYDHKNITHWMPLPKPPKEEES